MHYYRVFKPRTNKNTNYKAKNIAEKKAPVAAKPLEKVRFPIWVNMLMFSSINEK